MNKQTQKLFTDLLSLPTAPYKEGAVSAFIQAFAKKRGLTLKADKYGNLVVRYTHGKDPKPVALTAHMDHPGFEVLEATGRDLKARWLGGCDPNHFPGSRVTLIDGDEQLSGRVTSALGDGKVFEIRAQKALSGVEGPGETTTRSGLSAASCSMVALSLRTTSTSAPSSERYWKRLYVKLS